jgi:hypothetical protein
MSEAARPMVSAVAKADSIVLVFGWLAAFGAATTVLAVLARFARWSQMRLLANVTALLSCVAICFVVVPAMNELDSYLISSFTGLQFVSNLPVWSMYLLPLLGIVAAGIASRRFQGRRATTGT